MTRDEAQRIAFIISSADGGCSTCVRDLVEQLNDAALGFEWIMPEHFRFYIDYETGNLAPDCILVTVRQE